MTKGVYVGVMPMVGTARFFCVASQVPVTGANNKRRSVWFGRWALTFKGVPFCTGARAAAARVAFN